MKKIFCFMLLAALVGCSNDNETPQEEMVDVLMCMQHSNDYGYNIIAMSEDGVTRKALMTGDETYSNPCMPSCGSDGETLLVGLEGCPDATFFVSKNIRTGEIKEHKCHSVTDANYVNTPIYSSDMKSIYFSYKSVSNNELYFSKYDTATEQVEEFDTLWSALYPSLTNDANKVLCLGENGSYDGLFSVNPSNGSCESIEINGCSAHHPYYDRGLNKIIFIDNGNFIKMCDIDGSNVVTLYENSDGNINSPTINSTSTKIAYTTSSSVVYVADFKNGVTSNHTAITTTTDGIWRTKYIKIKKSTFDSLPDAEQYEN